MQGDYDSQLFLERLQTLFDKSLADLRAFAERESRPFEEIRDQVAKWHCKELFSPSTVPQGSLAEQVSSILRTTSRTLESLEEIAGLQSFFLVVNPNDPSDEGFLGGTVLGREFWRCHRGCGAAGARLSQEQCTKVKQANTSGEPALSDAPLVNAPPRRKGPASSLKSDVYSSVRDAVRAASGIRNAEMKWTDHSKLDTYGIRIVGWPSSVPLQNPSTLSVAQNKAVLEALRNGMLYFERLGAPSETHPGTSTEKPQNDPSRVATDQAMDISWAYQDPDEPVPTVSVDRSDCLMSARAQSMISHGNEQFVVCL
ncbi:uncharacterized protein B0H18DRAFT_884190 [Fomitopsis serialis]|uniref:uncharacterized protein n=1 Tax=Fomitopsis serialis TaxID=139415 RepID=UPI0020073C26|nr:uncharacterized protein B0H18DRAFT_884190 [Neoantrodia serialis]KAH9917037.1 hypothetical protein B0H18DRAFT_884190 [Neoantrodia serialis]